MVRNRHTKIRGHTPNWYDRLSTLQEGYYYPWESTTEAGGGEQAYTDMVREHLSPQVDVLEAGCGHGVDAVLFAPLCRSFRGYDQIDRWTTMARAACEKAGITNATFLSRNSSADRNGGQVKVPALTASTDVVISRRGPTNWIEDVPRFCRPGAVLLQLNPLAPLVEPPWNPDLPEDLRLEPPDGAGDIGMRQTIEERLAKVGLQIHSGWTYDVPEHLHTPRDLYRFLTFGNAPEEVPSWPESEPALSDVFARFASDQGLEYRNRRFLWKSVVPA